MGNDDNFDEKQFEFIDVNKILFRNKFLDLDIIIIKLLKHHLKI